MRYSQADLKVHRTQQGYTAVLRVQGADGNEVGLVARCSWEEARSALGVDRAAGVGFSFKKLARSIKKAASGIAKSKVFKTFMSAAAFLPPPVSSVASVANGAVKTLAGMKKGDPAALRVWKDAAERARANPASPTAAGMRLAIDAMGPPRFVRRVSPRTVDIVRAVLERLEQENAADAAPSADAPPPAPADAPAAAAGES
jgi:hypothetical protein